MKTLTLTNIDNEEVTVDNFDDFYAVATFDDNYEKCELVSYTDEDGCETCIFGYLMIDVGYIVGREVNEDDFDFSEIMEDYWNSF